MIQIYRDNDLLYTADVFMGAPVAARIRQGLIRMHAIAAGQQGKHILYTLAQRALVELDDGTMDIRQQPAGSCLKAVYDDLEFTCDEGAILAMNADNEMVLFVQEPVNVSGMLREFHRYATRMVRLDVP